MKSSREIEVAAAARNAARSAFQGKAQTVRGRLAPRLLAADLAGMLAARAGSVIIKPGIARKRRIAAAVGGALALASAIALRAAHRTHVKKTGDLPRD